MGAAGHQLQRLLPNTYRDGRGLPRASKDLPGAREVGGGEGRGRNPQVSAGLHHEPGDPASNAKRVDTTPDR